MLQIGLFRFHGLHNGQGGQHIVHGPVGVYHLVLKTVGFDGVAEAMGIAVAVLINGEQVQLVLAFEDSRVSVPEQQVEQEAQIKVGVVGKEQSVAGDELRNVPADPGFWEPPLPQVLGGDACKGLDFRRHKASGGQSHQFVVLPDHCGHPVNGLHRNGGEFDDLVPAVLKPRGLRVEEHQAVVFGKQGL